MSAMSVRAVVEWVRPWQGGGAVAAKRASESFLHPANAGKSNGAPDTGLAAGASCKLFVCFA